MTSRKRSTRKAATPVFQSGPEGSADRVFDFSAMEAAPAFTPHFNETPAEPPPVPLTPTPAVGPNPDGITHAAALAQGVPKSKLVNVREEEV